MRGQLAQEAESGTAEAEDLLLHGPALPAASPDQTQIDALFAEA